MRTSVVLFCALFLAGCATEDAPSSDAPSPGPVASTPATSPTTSPAASPASDPPTSATRPTPLPTGGAAPTPSANEPLRPEGPRARFAGCSGSGTVTFNTSPMREEDFAMLLPYGLLAGAHVTPIDHMYLAPPAGSVRDQFEVRAIADGVIYSMQPRDINVDTGAARAREWRMDIAHTCTFTSYFDLITSLDPALEAEYNKTQGGRTGPWSGIPVKAGQLVGRIGAQTLDFGVYDYNVTLAGFIVPEHYERESWKVHTVDPFPYFEEPTRSMLLAKNIRTAEPRAGKIDQDVDGRLVGNWFVLGTNGYAGANPSTYWDTHLAIVHDYLDNSQIRFSIGSFDGRARQFAVAGNAPDPSNVSVDTGLVKYELVAFEYYARNDPSRSGMGPTGVRPGDDVASRSHASVEGIALVMMLEPRLLKVEVFPGKTAAQVEGFTDAARVFER